MSEAWAARVQQLFDQLVSMAAEDRKDLLRNIRFEDSETAEEVEQLLEAYEADGTDVELHVRRTWSALARRDLSGLQVSHYRVIELLGVGGMAEVYLAENLHLRSKVALKFLPPHLSRDSSAKRRFIREAQSASALNHPNVCTIHDIDETEGGHLFIAMALYDGETLRDAIGRGRLGVLEAVDIGEQVACGLEAAHARGIIHRDIKPANIAITKEGRAVILDFGVAKLQEASSLLTVSGILGTAPYMSPEQARGEKLTPSTDVWSLGIVMYEMLAGSNPFLADYAQATAYRILNVDPPGLSSVRDDIPAAVERVVHRCLAKNSDDRYLSARDVVKELRAITALRPVPLPSPGSVLKQWWRVAVSKWHTASRFAKSMYSAVSVSVLALVGILIVQVYRPPAEPLGLAILPFVNVGVDSMLVEGLHHIVTGSLVRLEGKAGKLSVVPTDDVVRKGVRSTDEAFDAFQVELVVGPSAQDAGDELLLNLNLSHGPQGRIADSRQLRVAYAQVGRLQEDVVSALADLLGLHTDVNVLQELEVGGTAVSSAFLAYARARGLLHRGESEANVDEAIRLLDEAVAEDRNYAMAHAALGEAYLQKYRLTKVSSFVELAIIHGQRARDLAGTLAPARIALGLTYFEQGEYEAAEAEFLRAKEIAPNSASVHHKLGMVYLRLNQIERSESAYRRAIGLKGDYWLYHNGLGSLYHYEGRHEDAVPCFERVIELRPESPWGYNNLGVQYMALRQWEAAMGQFVYATQVDTTVVDAFAFAQNNIGRLFYIRRQFDESAHWFSLASVVDSLNYDNWDQLGNSWYMIDRRAEAVDAWRRVVDIASERLAINPNDGGALNYVAEAHAKLGQSERAYPALYRLLALERVEPGDFIVAAKVHEILGRRDSALHYVEMAFAQGAATDRIERSIWLDELRTDLGYSKILLGRKKDADDKT